MVTGIPRSLASRAFDTIAGNRMAEELFTRATSHRLRILAYHGVDDPDGFAAHMDHLRSHYEPVSVDQVLHSLEGAALPKRAVWVTFDDGHLSVVEFGVPILENWEIPFTMFLCPAVIDTSTPLWWQAVERSLAAGAEVLWDGSTFAGPNGSAVLIRRLKSAPDAVRRQAVADVVQDALNRRANPPNPPQLTTTALERLGAAGGTIGNHTWDHPTLNTCEPEEQIRQISQAHEYLRSWESISRPVIAYPNGNRTAVAEGIARELGYRIGLLFDHQLVGPSRNPLAWSRLRIGSDAPLSRFRAIISGAHPGLNRARQRLSTPRVDPHSR